MRRGRRRNEVRIEVARETIDRRGEAGTGKRASVVRGRWLGDVDDRSEALEVTSDEAPPSTATDEADVW